MLECNDGQTVLAESMVILEYLEDISPATYSAEQRARTRLFAALFPGKLSSFPILKTEPGSNEEAAAIENLRASLQAMNQFLLETPGSGPFLLGEEWTYAESAAAPFAQRLSHVLPVLRPELDPKQWMKEDNLLRLSEWFEAVCARSSCVESLPPPAELIESFGAMVERMKKMSA